MKNCHVPYVSDLLLHFNCEVLRLFMEEEKKKHCNKQNLYRLFWDIVNI